MTSFVGNSPVVTVYVGPSHKQFEIHETLLTRYSRVFDKAFNGGDDEDDEPQYGDFPAADRNVPSSRMWTRSCLPSSSAGSTA